MLYDFITEAMNSSNWMQATLEDERTVYYFREDLCGDVLISLEKKLTDYIDSVDFKNEDLDRFVNWADMYMDEDFRHDVHLCVDLVPEGFVVYESLEPPPDEVVAGWEINYDDLFEDCNFTEEEREAGREFMREYGTWE